MPHRGGDGRAGRGADVLKGVKGVNAVDAEGKTYRVNAESDLRGEISKAVVNSGAALIEMKIQEFSLDDIYMKYFKDK